VAECGPRGTDPGLLGISGRDVVLRRTPDGNRRPPLPGGSDRRADLIFGLRLARTDLDGQAADAGGMVAGQRRWHAEIGVPRPRSAIIMQRVAEGLRPADWTAGRARDFAR